MLLILFITIMAVQAQINMATHENVTTQENITSTTPYSSSDYNFIVKLSLAMREDKIPEYVISILYDTEYNNSNVSTSDIISLYSLRGINLTYFSELISRLNISIAEVISMDGFKACLNALNLNFKTIFDKILIIKLGAKMKPLQKFVADLDIDSLNFLTALGYGSDSDALEVFQKGNFSTENLQKALNNINKTNNQLFVAIRDEILDAVVQHMKVSDVARLLNRYNFKEKQASILWRLLNIDVNSNMAFKNMVERIKYRLELNSILGIISDKQYLFLNNISYSILTMEEEIAEIIAVTVNPLSSLSIIDRVKPEFTELEVYEVKSKDSKDLNSIDYGISNVPLENCALVKLTNNTFVERKLTEFVVSSGYALLEGELFLDNNSYLGSPIICNGIVYGLTRSYNGNKILFDSFVTNNTNPIPSVPTETAGTRRLIYSFVLVISSISLSLFTPFVIL